MSNTQDKIYKEPPPPGGSSSNRPYDGGANERTPLLEQQEQQQYAPTDNFNHNEGDKIVTYKVLSDKPAMTECPKCNRTVRSITENKIGIYTWLYCLPLCFIPFCNKNYKDVVHTCPHCGEIMKRYQRKCEDRWCCCC